MNYTKYDIGDKELAYIAGFFDGEGCIQIGSSGDLAISAANTDVTPLQFIMDIFEGSICVAHRATKERKKVYRWSVKAVDAPQVLKTILPYLICKKQEALLAIEFDSASESRKLDIALELRAIKQRGKVVEVK